VAACIRFPWIVLALAIIVAIASGYYTATHFAINTNTNEFISEKLQWRQNLIALEKAFPQRDDQIVVVIDGATPELAEAAAQSLTDKLKRHPDLYQSVVRPDGGPYFNQNALLFPPVAYDQHICVGQPYLAATMPNVGAVFAKKLINVIPLRALIFAPSAVPRHTPSEFCARARTANACLASRASQGRLLRQGQAVFRTSAFSPSQNSLLTTSSISVY
jgi:hypothetical protein